MNNGTKFVLLLLLLLIVFIGGVCLDMGYVDNLVKSNEPPTPSPVPVVAPRLTLAEQAERILAKMSDEEKIGQLLIVGIDSTQMDDNAKSLIEKYHAGGVILFDRNMVNPAQTATLVSQLQKEAVRRQANLPLFICIDQEGGSVLRMSQKVAKIPAQADLAATAQPAQARFWAEKNADELKLMGINVNFAPVLDLGLTSKRSYGADPATVTSFAREALRGYQAKGLLACLKHFPGIGRTKIDPHDDTSIIGAGRETLEETDIAPFRNLIRDFDNQTFFVMVSHLRYPAYDAKFPASLSKAIMGDLLREKLGFNGIIVTDDLEMGALTKSYSFAEMGYMAVNAGADMVLVCHDFNSQSAVYGGLRKALETGLLSRETLDDRVKRIIMNKIAKIHYQELDPGFAEKMVGSS